MSKREYLKTAISVIKTCNGGREYVENCIKHPTVYMRPIHIALLKIALKRA